MLLTLRAQSIRVATTASETQFSPRFLLLEQETWGERFSGCKAVKGWRRAEQQLVKQVIEVTPLNCRAALLRHCYTV